MSAKVAAAACSRVTIRLPGCNARGCGAGLVDKLPDGDVLESLAGDLKDPDVLRDRFGRRTGDDKAVVATESVL